MNVRSSVCWCVFLVTVAGCSSADVDAGPLPREPGPSSAGRPGTPVVVPMSCPVKPPDPSRVRVMVVDDGFDVRHPAFAGKIAGCYHIECPEEPGFAPKAGESEDDAARRMIELLGSPSATCAMSEGFTLNVDAYLERFDPLARDEWNGLLFDKSYLDPYTEKELDTMLELTSSADYHGTATAGAVAYENDVDLVLVQIELGTADDIDQRLSCIAQADIDLEIRLLSRPEVADAYVASPLSGRDLRLIELRKQHGVRVENHSFGPLSTDMYEYLLRNKGCARVELDEYARVIGDLDARRETVLHRSGALGGTEVLVLTAAGNEGGQIDDASDSFACVPGRTDTALVGAYDIYRGHATRAFFTNYGECIDVYGYGQSVILPTAAGLHGIFTGTSFAAPLAARHASSLVSQSPTTEALRERLFAARDANRFLPVSAMPAELNMFSRAPIGRRMTPTLSRSRVELGKGMRLLQR